jgi:hypothetical protein
MAFLGSRIKAYQEDKQGEISKAFHPLLDVEMKMTMVSKENFTRKMENEVLKKSL